MTKQRKFKPNLMVGRSTYRPIYYPEALEYRKKQQSMKWMVDEITFQEDVSDWNTKITNDEKNLLTNTFRFFVQGDVIVNDAYLRKYIPVLGHHPEIAMMMATFADSECFDDQSELLTSEGWVNVSAINDGHKLAQWNADHSKISYVTPTRVVSYPYNGVMHHYKSSTTDLMVTPNHQLLAYHPSSGVLSKAESYSRKLGRNYLYPVNGNKEGRLPTSSELLAIAVAADGSLQGLCPSEDTSNRKVIIAVSKDRKKERMVTLLDQAGIAYSRTEKGNYSKFYFNLPDGFELDEIKSLDFVNLEELSNEGSCILLEEIANWDSSKKVNGFTFYSTNKAAIDKVQALCVQSGAYYGSAGINRKAGESNGSIDGRKIVNKKDVLRLTVTKGLNKTYPHRKEVEYDGVVYCVTVPDSNIVARRNGKVMITGNCEHVVAYAKLLETVGLPDSEFEKFREIKEMTDKIDYLDKFDPSKYTGELTLEQKQEIALTLAVFSGFMEGVSLYASFAILLSFRQRGLMKKMGTVVEWSIRDEQLHCEAMSWLFRTFVKENPEIWTDEFKGKIYQACRDMVDLEDAFINMVFSNYNIEGIDPEQVKQYIRFIADRRLKGLGLKENFGVSENPIEWMEWVLMAGHNNFFESRPTEYNRNVPDNFF